MIGGPAVHQLGNDLLRQQVEHLRVAEEAGDVDEQVRGQKITLADVAAQQIDVAGRVGGGDPRHAHAPFDPALQRTGLVEREIMPRLRAQKIDDCGQARLLPRRRLQPGAHPGRAHAPLVGRERVRNPGDGKHKIHRAGQDRVARHPVVAGLLRVLHDDQPVPLPHRLQPQAAVGAGSGQDHADGARAVVRRQRRQQMVERQARAVADLRLGEMQSAAADREVAAGRDDIQVLARDRHPLCRLPYRHRGVAGQQIDHQAFVVRIEMLDHDERHAGARRQRAQQLAAGVEPAGGRADGDHREILLGSRRCRHGHGAAGRRCPRGFGPVGTTSRHLTGFLDVPLGRRFAPFVIISAPPHGVLPAKAVIAQSDRWSNAETAAASCRAAVPQR